MIGKSGTDNGRHRFDSWYQGCDDMVSLAGWRQCGTFLGEEAKVADRSSGILRDKTERYISFRLASSFPHLSSKPTNFTNGTIYIVYRTARERKSSAE